MTWPFAWPETLKLKGPLGWGLASLACFIVFLFLAIYNAGCMTALRVIVKPW